mmetsp:Transcript_31103/g.96763  ORF Transcript_31103/g.96763 Transcript_31103/m.96763 type:complete len:294 (-) Transcript_31103:365-1246(-)
MSSNPLPMSAPMGQPGGSRPQSPRSRPARASSGSRRKTWTGGFVLRASRTKRRVAESSSPVASSRGSAAMRGTQARCSSSRTSKAGSASAVVSLPARKIVKTVSMTSSGPRPVPSPESRIRSAMRFCRESVSGDAMRDEMIPARSRLAAMARPKELNLPRSMGRSMMPRAATPSNSMILLCSSSSKPAVICNVDALEASSWARGSKATPPSSAVAAAARSSVARMMSSSLGAAASTGLGPRLAKIFRRNLLCSSCPLPPGKFRMLLGPKILVVVGFQLGTSRPSTSALCTCWR